MKFVGDNVIVVTIMTTVIALIGHLDGGGASTFCIVVPSMLPVYKKMHMRPTTLLRCAVLAMGVLNLMPWSGPTSRAASVLGIEAGELWHTLLPIQAFGVVLCLAHAYLAGVQEKARGAGLNGILAQELGAVTVETSAEDPAQKNELARPKLFAVNLCLTVAVIALLVWDQFPSYFPFISPMVPATLLGVGLADVDIKDHIKASFLYVWGFPILCMIFAVIIGVIVL